MRASASAFTCLRVFPIGHQPRETDTPPVRVADEVGLLRPLDFARRRIDALDRLPFVQAFRGDQASRPAPGVAPHRFPGGFLDARVEAHLRRLRLLPPMGHQAPTPGGELDSSSVAERHPQERLVSPRHLYRSSSMSYEGCIALTIPCSPRSKRHTPA